MCPGRNVSRNARSEQRFFDNEELRYSLRSLQQNGRGFAIRNVYLLTSQVRVGCEILGEPTLGGARTDLMRVCAAAPSACVAEHERTFVSRGAR